jgi:hypothetical protein
MSMRSLRSKRKGNSLSCLLTLVPDLLSVLVASFLSLCALELIIVVDGFPDDDVTGLPRLTEGRSSSLENCRPDTSPARFAIAALRAAAGPPGNEATGNEATEKAVAFVIRSQNLESEETLNARIQTYRTK